MTRVTALTEITSFASDDLLPIVDKSDTAQSAEGSTRSISAGNLLNRITNINLLQNGDFINNATNGYGNDPDNWTDDGNSNAVQGGNPTLTKAELISVLGIADGDIEGFWNLDEASGNATDESSNSYDLTDTNTVGSSNDGLLAVARDFESTNTEYFVIADASCPNLEITGSQTWFAFVKCESVAGDQVIMSKYDTTANQKYLNIATTTKVFSFSLSGLSTETVSSDIVPEVGKWYFVCGVYDSSNSKLKIWVNGIKSEVTSSGTTDDSDANFVIGADLADSGDTAQHFFDGLMQNAGVLSVALSDEQVKALWAYTSYHGMKTRRLTSDGYMYQELPQSVVQSLRGKVVTFSAQVYQTAASTMNISIDDGQTETTSDTDTTINEWVTVCVTKTISDDTDSITLKLNHDTANGSGWWKEVKLEYGSNCSQYIHSQFDFAKFSRLLELEQQPSASGYIFTDNSALPGWIPLGTDLTFGTADDPTYTATLTGNYTHILSVGMKLFVSQATGGRKYFIISGISYSSPTTTLTLLGGNNYNLENEAIYLPQFGSKESYGFPVDPDDWDIIVQSTSDDLISSPTQNVWDNPTSSDLGHELYIDVPIGLFLLGYNVNLAGVDTNTGQESIDTYATLAMVDNSEDDKDFTTRLRLVAEHNAGGSDLAIYGNQSKYKKVDLSAADRYYLNTKTTTANIETTGFYGSLSTTEIRAKCLLL